MTQPTQSVAAGELSTGRKIARLLLVAVTILLLGMVLRILLTRFARSGGIDLGVQMPAITAAGWLNGEPPTPESLRGKVVVIEFWATWCNPCREKTPELVETYHRFQDREVVFLGLTSEDSQEVPKIRNFIKEFNVPWVIGYGAEETFARFETDGIPRVWVVGRNGKVVWDSYSAGTLEAALEEALSSRS